MLCPGLRLLGVILKPDRAQPFEAARVEQVVNCPEGVQQALATCHSLGVLQGQVVGDPLDRQLFTASGWQLSQVSPLNISPAFVMASRACLWTP